MAMETKPLDVDWRDGGVFSFPTRRKQALVVPWAASQHCSQYFSRSLGGHAVPLEALGVTEFVHRNYCVPHAKAIQSRGRHLLCIKIYGGQHRSLFWWMPREMVHDQYGSVAQCREKELESYPKLVDSYPVDSAIAVHVEMFTQQRGMQQRVYAGGFCLHQPNWEDPASVEKNVGFANCTDQELEQLAKKREKARMKRLRQRQKRKGAKAQEAEQLREEEEADTAAEEQLRRGLMLRVGVEHSSQHMAQIRALSDEKCLDFQELLQELKLEEAQHGESAMKLHALN